MKRPLPPSVLLVAIVILGAAHVLAPLGMLIAFPLNLAGMLPLASGVYLNLAADALLKRHQTTVKPSEASARLVTAGVYGRTRNPMYLGFVLILAGMAMLAGSVTPWAVVFAFAVLMDRTYVRIEEQMLRARFGGEWHAYARAVRKWV